jgi:RNA polymerase sigma-70 factor (ECF subfamily)
MMGVMAGRLSTPLEAVVHPRDFDAWMRAEQRRVFRLCWRFLPDRDEAETATQEVFLKAWQALGRSGGEELADPAKWLTRVTVNTCLDRVRSRRWQFWKKRPGGEDEAVILGMAAAVEPSAEDEMFAKDIQRRLAEALEKLSLRQRTVFVLRHYEDRSLDEIAGILGLDTGTVKAHLARALAKLRRELHDLYWRQAPSNGVVAGVATVGPGRDGS